MDSKPVSSMDRQPPKAAVEEAKQNPGGWVYEIDQKFDPNGAVPPEGVIGAWKVDDDGIISGDFIPNPRYSKNAD
jgi:hypothetical protein